MLIEDSDYMQRRNLTLLQELGGDGQNRNFVQSRKNIRAHSQETLGRFRVVGMGKASPMGSSKPIVAGPGHARIPAKLPLGGRDDLGPAGFLGARLETQEGTALRVEADVDRAGGVPTEGHGLAES